MTFPEWPNKIGKRGKRKNPDGEIRTFTIVDEIIHQQHNAPHKLLYLQKLRADDDGSEELRFCYYIIGKKERTRGKWVFGQYAPFIPKEDFEEIIRLARERKWIDV